MYEIVREECVGVAQRGHTYTLDVCPYSSTEKCVVSVELVNEYFFV